VPRLQYAKYLYHVILRKALCMLQVLGQPKRVLAAFRLSCSSRPISARICTTCKDSQHGCFHVLATSIEIEHLRLGGKWPILLLYSRSAALLRVHNSASIVKRLTVNSRRRWLVGLISGVEICNHGLRCLPQTVSKPYNLV
jgi:hypothetical protein